MSSTTRFPNGVTNVGEGTIFADLKQLAAPLYHTYMEDFDYYVQSQWDEVLVGTGTVSNGDLDGGALFVNLPAASDSGEAVLSGRNFSLADLFQTQVTKPLFFETSVLAQVPLDCAAIVGLSRAGLIGGLYFYKPQGSSQFEFRVKPDGNAPVATTIPSAILLNTGWLKLGFVVEPGGEIKLFVNGQYVGLANGASSATTQSTYGPYVFADSSAGSNTLLVDYIFAAKER